jgi:hypothetical protein
VHATGGTSSAVFALSNVVHLFPDELSSRRGRRFAVARVAPRTLECFLFRRDTILLAGRTTRHKAGLTHHLTLTLLLREDPLASSTAFDTIETVVVKGRAIPRETFIVRGP